MLLAVTQLWWFLFGHLNRGDWSGNFFVFLELLLGPAMLYVAGASLFPSAGAEADLGAHFHARRKWIFLPLAVFATEPVIGALLEGTTPMRPQTAFSVFFAAIALTGAFSANRRLHAALPAVTGVVLLGFVALFRTGLE